MSTLRLLRLFFVPGLHALGDSAGQDLGFYTAAAFQNAIVGSDDPRCDVQPNDLPCHGRAAQRANLAKFDVAALSAKRQGADIIVFNEGGVDADLWNPGKWQDLACEPIPEPSSTAIPCDDAINWNDFPVTHNVSCMARRHQLVMVINTCDRQPCRSGSRVCQNHSDVDCCPSTGFELFNTQLAFSETGEMLAKYHKTHNYDRAADVGETGEGLCCWPPRTEYAYFDTSFGVRFGMHICFDILFRTPGAKLAMDPGLGIRDFVYSTHWELPGPPMLPAIEIHQGWTRALGVNLIAANAGLGPAHAGSGIYSRGKALAAHYDPRLSRDDRLLVARVPKLPKEVAVDVVRRPQIAPGLGAPPIPLPTFRSLNISPGQSGILPTISAASGGFVCHFSATLSNSSIAVADRFLLMAVNGSWMGKVLRSRSCVVVRCGPLSEEECAARSVCTEYKDESCPVGRSLWNTASDLVATTFFDSFELRGNFEIGDIVLPIVGTSLGQLVDHEDISSNQGVMSVKLRAPLHNAMLFALPEDGHPSPAEYHRPSHKVFV